MGRFSFKLPDVGEGIAEAEIVAWPVKPGDRIGEDQPLVDVMTDKATVEITSPIAGAVLELQGEIGQAAAVGAVIAVLEVEGAADLDPPSPAASLGAAAPPSPAGGEARMSMPSPSPAPALSPESAPAAATRSIVPGARPLASPAVRRRARDMGVDLARIRGRGPAGRVTQTDLDALREGPHGRPILPTTDSVEEVKVVGLRRRIAERMTEAKRRIPHFSYIEEVDMTELERVRAQLNLRHAGQPRLTVLPFLARALVRALPSFPQMNALYDDDAGVVRRHAAVHLGLATQTPGGLVVPVVRHAERLDLWQTAAEIARLAEAAREGKASREELSGSTITITSLGPLGGLATTPVINRPEVAIVGPNRIVERPVVIGGAIVVRKMMNLSSSFDHRVVDGWDAAEFVQRLKLLLETPALLFVETP
jgi:2-oxoisovalerate dehydrogenase E2 component (dihydrolipoyl transacylase)